MATDAAMPPTLVSMSQRETGLTVVLFLRDHAMETNGAWLKARHRCSPKLQAESFAAEIGSDKVEANKSEAGIVTNCRDAADGGAIEKSHHEAPPIGFGKTCGIVKAWIPALARGPVDREA